MAILRPLDPAPSVTASPLEFIAMEAGRSADGLLATIQVMNGTVRTMRVVKLASQGDRQAFAQEVAAGSSLEAGAIEAALFKLINGIEVLLRQREEATEPRPASQATQLVELAANAAFFHSPDGEAFATIPMEGHVETWPLRTKVFRRWLARQFYEIHQKVPGSQALHDALGVLEGQAVFDGPQHPVFTRLAEHEGHIYLDLTNEHWEAVKITATGWTIVQVPPVKFRRMRGMLPLPYPVTGGRVQELRLFMNLEGDTDWILLKAWLVGALRPHGPYPILTLHGEQGSAKSTLTRVIRALIDPNSAPLRAEPRDIRDVMIGATNAWALAYDNLSHLPTWLSDVFCRLSTGGGFSTRELYTDQEEVLFDAQRPVVLNGIEELATRGDLLDRAIILYMPAIPEEQRRSEVDFWHAFELVRPRIFGALLEAVSMALGRVSTVKLSRLPRMADFAAWVTAAEPGLDHEPGVFIQAYTSNRQAANELALEASLIFGPLRSSLGTNEWQGTATELLRVLGNHAGESTKREKGWPTNGRVLSNALRRLAPNLRAMGIDITFGRREPRTGRRYITLSATRVSELEQGANFVSPVSPPSPPVETQQVSGDALTAGDARPGRGDAGVTQQDGPGKAHQLRMVTKSDAGDAKIPTNSHVWEKI
jgi:hypothetical protein